MQKCLAASQSESGGMIGYLALFLDVIMHIRKQQTLF
jgi:hypothetical protein